MKSFSYTVTEDKNIQVTFTHDDNTTHQETLSGPAVPKTNGNGELTDFLTTYASNWEKNKAAEIESEEIDPSVTETAGTTINL